MDASESPYQSGWNDGVRACEAEIIKFAENVMKLGKDEAVSVIVSLVIHEAAAKLGSLKRG